MKSRVALFLPDIMKTSEETTETLPALPMRESCVFLLFLSFFCTGVPWRYSGFGPRPLQ